MRQAHAALLGKLAGLCRSGMSQATKERAVRRLNKIEQVAEQTVQAHRGSERDE